MSTFALLVGGGPAPGLNGVISAVTQEAITRGHKVLGIKNGYELLMGSEKNCAVELNSESVSTIHRLGGSIIGTSRANPQKSPELLNKVVHSLLDLGVEYLVTVGGDDTSTSAGAIARVAQGKIKVAHVPKTIDNDLPLPNGIQTFGFETAREVGSGIVESLMADARASRRWYLVVAMGRKAGHLALGMGFSGAASITLIPEQFPNESYSVSTIVNELVSSILKSSVSNRDYGVAVIAEGILEKIDPISFPELNNAERDEHGHIRYAELDFGGMLKRAVVVKLKEIGTRPITIVEKNVGYELRCADPNSFDREYTKLLGYGAVELLLRGSSEIMVSVQYETLMPIKFSEMIDSKTGKTAVRYVNLQGALFQAAQSYMMRILPGDLADSDKLGAICSLTSLSSDDFMRSF